MHSVTSNPATGLEEEQLPRQFGKYTLLRRLATGGMAQLYLALQRAVAGFEKLVVIKCILPELTRDPAFVEMLLSEARTAATLNHPNVVQTFDVGEVMGTYYIAMEHINGEDIRAIVRAMKRVGLIEFPLEYALSIILGVCGGLGYAHDKRDLDGTPLNIVHRDISPQNILITHSGDVKIVDFGIAKSTEAAVGEKTGAGQLKGKVPYMSPEQARGLDIDHRSDIFAVGIVLFELTTGRRLFKAKSEYETLKLICEREYPFPSQVRPGYSPALERVVMKALEKNPDFRYQSASHMQADLEAVVREERIPVSTVSLANWMKMLFEDKIAAQKEALQDVKQLADVIASQQTSDPGAMSMVDIFGASGVGTTTGTTTGASTVDAMRTGTGIIIVPPRSPLRYVAIGGGVLALVAAGLFLGLSGSSDNAQGAATASPSAGDQGAAKSGKLVVKSDPDGATVLVGGVDKGKTPIEVELPLDYDIEVQVVKDGFDQQKKTFKLTAERPEETFSAILGQASGAVVFEISPPPMTISVDKKIWKAKGNKIEELAAGDHIIVFSHPSYAPHIVKVTLKKGETKHLKAILRKGDPTKTKPGSGATSEPEGNGMVSVSSRGGFCSNVTVGGKSVGPTPVANIPVKAGPVSIVCTTADGRKIASGANVQPDGVARVTITIPDQ